MNLKFVNWYTQALGSTLGIIACIYAYLNGFMFVYGNINKYFDFLGFTGILSSYTLLPLCILTLIFAILKPYIGGKTIYKFQADDINNSLIITTIIIGFIGARIYFLIPALLIAFNLYSNKIFNKENKTEFIEPENLNTLNYNNKLESVKMEMALELLKKNSDIQFISELTGLSNNDLETIKLGVKN